MESESLLREENTEERFLDKFFKDSTFVVFIIPLFTIIKRRKDLRKEVIMKI